MTDSEAKYRFYIDGITDPRPAQDASHAGHRWSYSGGLPYTTTTINARHSPYTSENLERTRNEIIREQMSGRTHYAFSLTSVTEASRAGNRFTLVTINGYDNYNVFIIASDIQDSDSTDIWISHSVDNTQLTYGEHIDSNMHVVSYNGQDRQYDGTSVGYVGEKQLMRTIGGHSKTLRFYPINGVSDDGNQGYIISSANFISWILRSNDTGDNLLSEAMGTGHIPRNRLRSNDWHQIFYAKRYTSANRRAYFYVKQEGSTKKYLYAHSNTELRLGNSIPNYNFYTNNSITGSRPGPAPTPAPTGVPEGTLDSSPAHPNKQLHATLSGSGYTGNPNALRSYYISIYDKSRTQIANELWNDIGVSAFSISNTPVIYIHFSQRPTRQAWLVWTTNVWKSELDTLGYTTSPTMSTWVKSTPIIPIGMDVLIKIGTYSHRSSDNKNIGYGYIQQNLGQTQNGPVKYFKTNNAFETTPSVFDPTVFVVEKTSNNKYKFRVKNFTGSDIYQKYYGGHQEYDIELDSGNFKISRRVNPIRYPTRGTGSTDKWYEALESSKSRNIIFEDPWTSWYMNYKLIPNSSVNGNSPQYIQYWSPVYSNIVGDANIHKKTQEKIVELMATGKTFTIATRILPNNKLQFWINTTPSDIMSDISKNDGTSQWYNCAHTWIRKFPPPTHRNKMVSWRYETVQNNTNSREHIINQYLSNPGIRQFSVSKYRKYSPHYGFNYWVLWATHTKTVSNNNRDYDTWKK